ncbi:MAG: hypothetical protein P794_03905 [Epsilonproteobacteria bacterium (ex Lamellibrachia satsuma)]|nr:MAG: hypothetical protein P794_03905 [Epsilonproteobacteria bacterium (ex Lamellibrachia satsuma)]
MKKITISTILVAAIMTTSLNAGSVGGFGGSLETTQWARFGAETVDRANAYTEQLKQYATQLQQYEQQIMQYQNQFDSYKAMLQNIGQLPQQQWDQFSQSVMGLKQSLDFGQSLNFTASSYDQDFSKLFKGYDQYLASAKNGSLNFGDTYKQLNKSTRDTVNGALKSLGLQASDMENDESTMRQLQTLSSSATGQKAAIQAASEIALHQTHTLKKLQQTIMTQANMQGEFMAKQNEEKALKQAATEAYLSDYEEPSNADDRPMP